MNNDNTSFTPVTPNQDKTTSDSNSPIVKALQRHFRRFPSPEELVKEKNNSGLINPFWNKTTEGAA